MEPLEFKKRPDSAVPVPFFALGLFGLVVFNIGMLLIPSSWKVPVDSHGILLLHLAVLGVITPVMMGADYQLIPVVLHRPLAAPGLATPIVVLYTVGVAVFLFGWGLGQPSLIAVGGTAAGAALLGFCAHAGRGLGRLRHWSGTALGLGGGLLFLAATAVLGPWMALGVGGAVPAPFSALLPLHAAVGLGGWLLLTIIGATYQLMPFFAATEPSVQARWSVPAVAAVAAGVVTLLISVLLPAPLAPYGAGTVLLGLSLWAWDMLRLARHGRQARREPVAAYSLLAVAGLWLSVAGATASLAGVPDLTAPAAYLGLVTAPSLLIFGQLQKILPFIAALDVSLAAKRRGRVPKTEALFPRERAFVILWGLVPGYLGVLVGLMLGSVWTIRVATAPVLIAALAHVAQQTRALTAWRGARRA